MTVPTASPDPDLFFFLSFAGDSDQDDALVHQFFNDLRADVRVNAGTRRTDPAPTGFLSLADLRIGTDWSEEVARALGTCRVFVALCSPGYFQSPFCGLEWQVFNDRLHAYHLRFHERAPSLLPICWTPMPMPPVAARIQHSDRQLSQLVPAIGLRQVMRLQRHHDAYVEFVANLAGLIVHNGRRYPVPRIDINHDLAFMPRAFPAGGAPPSPISSPPPLPPNPRPNPDGATLPDLDTDNGFPYIHGIRPTAE